MKGDIVPVKERYTEYGKDWVKRYSDNGMTIERDGELYSEAVDEAKYEFERVYYETDIPIEAELIEPSPIDEDIVQKAEAFDYLTGRSDGDE